MENVKRTVSPTFAKIVESWTVEECTKYIETINNKLSDRNCIEHMKPIYQTGKEFVENHLEKIKS